MSSINKKTHIIENLYSRFVLLAFLVLIALQSSCSSPTELSGEVFIVTRGAGNYKLGAVEVLAIPESQFMEFALGKKSEKEALLTDHKAKINECGTFPGYTRLQEIEYRICQLKAEGIKEKIGNLYFTGLPNPAASAITNGDGKFILKLPNRDKYIIVAKASRKTPELTEVYFWFIPFEAKEAQQNIIVSNNNMYEPETAPF